MHPAAEQLLRYFRYDHLPPHLQAVSRPFGELAHALACDDKGEAEGFDDLLVPLAGTQLDGPELTVALRKLLEAKDCAVRAALDS